MFFVLSKMSNYSILKFFSNNIKIIDLIVDLFNFDYVYIYFSIKKLYKI